VHRGPWWWDLKPKCGGRGGGEIETKKRLTIEIAQPKTEKAVVAQNRKAERGGQGSGLIQLHKTRRSGGETKRKKGKQGHIRETVPPRKE